MDTSTLKVDSTNNRVGIGTASPAAAVSVLIGSEFLHFGFGANNDNYYTVGSVGSHLWRNGGTEQMRLNTTANLVLKGGPVGANGVGLTFPATQVASSDANCLDDYEEGTWTATITGSTIAGVGVYTDNTGKYTKVGNLVTVQVYINWTAHTGTGDMRISGLPFTSADLSGCAFGFVNSIALTAGYILTGFTNSSLISLQQTPSGGGASIAVPVDSVGTFVVTVSYRV